MVVDIVKGREKVGSFCPVGWKITDELVTVELTNFLVQRVTARSREDQN